MIGEAPAEDSEDTLHTPAERAAASRSTWVSVALNIALSALEIAVGIVTKSHGLIADFVVLFASHHRAKDADAEHPYGHARFETSPRRRPAPQA